MLNTSSQKKAGANSQRPKTTFSQMQPVTMIVYSVSVLTTTEAVAIS